MTGLVRGTGSRSAGVHRVMAVLLAGAVFAGLRWLEDGQALSGLVAGTAFGVALQSIRAVVHVATRRRSDDEPTQPNALPSMRGQLRHECEPNAMVVLQRPARSRSRARGQEDVRSVTFSRVAVEDSSGLDA